MKWNVNEWFVIDIEWIDQWLAIRGIKTVRQIWNVELEQFLLEWSLMTKEESNVLYS